MKTLLNGVNEILKKTDVLDSDGLLTTLTDSARQMYIDTAVQVINEFLDELFTGRNAKPRQMRDATITLQTGIREYGLHSCLITLRQEYHLVDQTNDQIITILSEEDGGHRSIILGDLGQDDNGLPSFCAVSPVNGKLVMDRLPTAADNGNVFKYRYDRDLEMDEATDCFPFNNAVFRAMVPGATELWKLYERGEFNETIWNRSMSRAKKYLRGLPPRNSWTSSGGGGNQTDPLEHASPVS